MKDAMSGTCSMNRKKHKVFDWNETKWETKDSIRRYNSGFRVLEDWAVPACPSSKKVGWRCDRGMETEEGEFVGSAIAESVANRVGGDLLSDMNFLLGG
jgi:hypothetical protein